VVAGIDEVAEFADVRRCRQSVAARLERDRVGRDDASGARDDGLERARRVERQLVGPQVVHEP
jgi:hypothetical protein